MTPSEAAVSIAAGRSFARASPNAYCLPISRHGAASERSTCLGRTCFEAQNSCHTWPHAVEFPIREAAFFSEIIRAGILGLPVGQFQAAQSLGMTTLQGFRHIILPQALRAMLPIMLTQCIVIFQDTSLVYVIALGDFFSNAVRIGERDGSVVQLLLFAGLVYWVICAALSGVVRIVQLRLREA